MPSRSNLEDREVPRNVAGPASPEVRRREIAKRVAEREPPSSAPSQRAKPREVPLFSADEPNPTRDLSAYTASRRLKQRGKYIDHKVDSAQ